MGIEADKEKSALKLKRQCDKEIIKKMIKRYNKNGFDEIVKIMREISKEIK
jgi:hypothetical protein